MLNEAWTKRMRVKKTVHLLLSCPSTIQASNFDVTCFVFCSFFIPLIRVASRPRAAKMLKSLFSFSPVLFSWPLQSTLGVVSLRLCPVLCLLTCVVHSCSPLLSWGASYTFKKKSQESCDEKWAKWIHYPLIYFGFYDIHCWTENDKTLFLMLFFDLNPPTILYILKFRLIPESRVNTGAWHCVCRATKCEWIRDQVESDFDNKLGIIWLFFLIRMHYWRFNFSMCVSTYCIAFENPPFSYLGCTVQRISNWGSLRRGYKNNCHSKMLMLAMLVVSLYWLVIPIDSGAFSIFTW